MDPQLPDLNIAFETPQIGDQVGVMMTVSDQKQILQSRILLPSAMARQLGRAMMMAADKAEKQVIVPQSQIAKA